MSFSKMDENEPYEDPKPVGEPFRISGSGRRRRCHYESFEFCGTCYNLEDVVLLAPEGEGKKPYVALIKDITQATDGSTMFTGQLFYRPEEAVRKNGGNWQTQDPRELFYSFSHYEVHAEAVMHKCVVHFISFHKQIPKPKQHPGFIVQKVYDTIDKKLWKLTDKVYEDDKQQEIDLLVQKTLARLGVLPDIEFKVTATDNKDQLKGKITVQKRNLSPVNVSRVEKTTNPETVKAGPLRNCAENTMDYYNILAKFNALTGNTQRDKWRERLLQCVQYMCKSNRKHENEDEAKHSSDGLDNGHESHTVETRGRPKDIGSFKWPDAFVRAVSALEQASEDALSADSLKYNQKLRQLLFNLKISSVLARRLLTGELEPATILKMSSHELKEGQSSGEMTTKEPDESAERMQTTDARCSRCREYKVGVRNIIQAGRGTRYKLECIACGNTWYAWNRVSMLRMDEPSPEKGVGTPDNCQSEDVKEGLVSPRLIRKAQG